MPKEEEIIEEEELDEIEEEEEMAIPPKLDDDKKEDDEEEEEAEEEEEEEPEAFKTFKTEEEYQEWRAKEEERIEAEGKKAEEKKTEEGIKLYEGYIDPKTGEWVGATPKDLNAFANDLMNHPEVIKRLQEHVTPATQKAIAEQADADKQEEADLVKGFDKEYDALAEKGKVPARNTKEGKIINGQINQVGIDYGQNNITKAHKLWSKLPKAEGGGLEYTPPAKAKLNKQKQQASKIKGSRGGNAKLNKQEQSYQELHNSNLDEIVDKAMEEE